MCAGHHMYHRFMALLLPWRSKQHTGSEYDLCRRLQFSGITMSWLCQTATIDAKWIYDNVSSGTTVRIGDNLDYPLTNPTRYTWTGGAFGSDPTYR